MPRSHSHYRDYLDLRGDGRIVLYKRADHQNPKWTVRLSIPTVSGFVVRSTKTTDDFEARRFAEDLYYRLEGKARRGEPINSPSFRTVFSEWSKVPVADQVVRSAKYVNGNVRRVELWALQYFGDLTIDRVTETKLADYVDWRLSQPKRPAVVTLKNERTAIQPSGNSSSSPSEGATYPRFRSSLSSRAGSMRVRTSPSASGINWSVSCRHTSTEPKIGGD